MQFAPIALLPVLAFLALLKAIVQRGYRLGSGVPPRHDLFSDQDLYEIMVYGRLLTEREIEALNVYLRGKGRGP